jgi:hypothetical protein
MADRAVRTMTNIDNEQDVSATVTLTMTGTADGPL